MPDAGTSTVSLSCVIRLVPLVKMLRKFENHLKIFNELSICYKHQKQPRSSKAMTANLEPRDMQV